jgi:ribose transport system ATP-binding protein
MMNQAQAVIDRLGAQFKASDRVMALTIAEQQQVEIARALHRNSRVLVMDEPTAALSSRETHRLFELILRLRDEGMAIIYISHRMAEVYELSDRVSVLRDGQYVGSLTRDKLNASELVRMMVGRPLSDLFNKERDIPPGQPRLRVEDLTDGGKVKASSLVVRAGEIVGLAGLVGAGRSELAQLIFGVRRATGGVIEIDGEPVVIHSPRAAIDLGIGFLTENRKEQGCSSRWRRRRTSPWPPSNGMPAGACSIAKRRRPLRRCDLPAQYSRAARAGARRRPFRRQSAKAADLPLGRHRSAHFTA